MKKYLLFAIILFITFPSTMKASICSNSDKVRYQELAKNISTSYDYVEENGTVKFNVTFSNIDSSIFLKETTTNTLYPHTSSEMTIYGLNQGTTYKFETYSNNFICEDNNFYTIYVTLPYYNPYYTDELCNGIEDYKYCNKWFNKPINYDEFKQNVLNYINKMNMEHEIQNNDENKNNIFQIIINFYIDYYYIILPFIIILGIVLIRKYNKKYDLF